MDSAKQLKDLSKVYMEAVYGGGKKEEKKDTRLVVTAADKKANTKAYQNYKAGNKAYKAADHLGEGIKGEDNETRKAAAAERKAGVKTRLSPSAGKANVAKMLWSIQNAKSNPQNEGVALDANTKIKKQEQRKKDEKEYVRLMAILAHQKDLKKRGLSSSYTPEGDQLDERNKSDDAFIEGETGSKTSRRNLTRAMSSTKLGMGKGASGKAEDTAKRRERHQADRGVKTKGTKAGHSGSAYPKKSSTMDTMYPHKKKHRLSMMAKDKKIGIKRPGGRAKFYGTEKSPVTKLNTLLLKLGLTSPCSL